MAETATRLCLFLTRGGDYQRSLSCCVTMTVMKRAVRWLFSALSLMSLAILVASALAWPVSYWLGASIPVIRGEQSTIVVVNAGRFGLYHFSGYSLLAAGNLRWGDAWPERSV